MPEEAEINLGEGVNFGRSTHFQNLVARANHSGMVELVSSQLQPEISLNRGADIRGSSGVNTPSAVLILMLQNITLRFLESLTIARAEQRVQKDVIRFQCGIGFQFAAPVALFVLIRKKELASTIDGGSNPAGEVINFAETHLRRSRRIRRRGGIVHN